MCFRRYLREQAVLAEENKLMALPHPQRQQLKWGQPEVLHLVYLRGINPTPIESSLFWPGALRGSWPFLEPSCRWEFAQQWLLISLDTEWQNNLFLRSRLVRACEGIVLERYAREERDSFNMILDPFKNGKGLKHSLADQKQRESKQLLNLKTASGSYSPLTQKWGVNHIGINTPHWSAFFQTDPSLSLATKPLNLSRSEHASTVVFF